MRTVFERIVLALVPTVLVACGGGGGGTGPTVSTTPNTTTYLGVAAGGGHTVAIKSDGTLLAWGLNLNGQLGDGTFVEKWTPNPVGLGAAVTGSVISAGEFHTAALGTCTTGGCTLTTWGSNDSGRLGNGTPTESNVPVTITGKTWLTVATGGAHTLAIKRDGTSGGVVLTWGRNDKGQLGVLDLNNKSVPTEISNCLYQFPIPVGVTTLWHTCSKKWLAVAAGSQHSLGLLQTGELYGWGLNTRGQIGIAANAGVPAPVGISVTESGGVFTFNKKFTSIAAGGDHSLAILNDGTLHAWGANGFGQLGLGTLDNVATPTRVNSDNDWAIIAAGGVHNDESSPDLPVNGGHSLAIKTDGTLWAWGANGYGQLGLGHVNDITAPTQVGKDRDWKRVSAGKTHSFAWKGDGSLWGWGNNFNGQLGNGSGGTAAKIVVPTRLN